MKIAIKNPAPRGVNLERWGDFHFGKSLEEALVRRGAEVVQHFWPDWNQYDGEDAALWLRGKRRCSPRPGIVNAIWILSHPSSVTNAELTGFDLVFAASDRFASELQERGLSGVEVMRQCTDAKLFRPDPTLTDADRLGLLFVASSRGVGRPILQWALAAGFVPNVIGQGWDQVGLGFAAQAGYIANAELPGLYNAARYGMNDHWGDMAHYQMINNRVFDCLACGLPLISDGFPELAKIAGRGVWIVDGPQSFKDAYWAIRLDYSAARTATQKTWKAIGSDYTFDARAGTIMDLLGAGSQRPSYEAVPMSATPAAELANILIDKLGGVGSEPTKIRLAMLHVFPDIQTSGYVSAIPSLSTLAAGVGDGPWNLRLDDDIRELGTRQFDMILIERGDLWSSRASPALLSLLVAHLKPGGLLCALDGTILREARAQLFLAKVSDAPLILRKTVRNFDSILDT